MATRPRPLAGDGVVAALLFVAAFTYLCCLPRDLGGADESYFLYEAKRILDGEVMYRDFFQFITPLASYAMAFLFWAFGTTIATARVSMAVLHGLTVVVLYATCRALGVRKEIAALTGIAYLAVCQPAWPHASPHWVSTNLAAVLLLMLIAGPWAARPRLTVIPGLANGILIGVQQQKGVVLAVGVCALLLVDHLMSRRYPAPEAWRRLAVRLAFFSAGISIVVVPLLVTFVVMAGFEPVFDALVVFPLDTYRRSIGIHWGDTAPLAAHYSRATLPTLLKYMPLILLVPLARGLTKLVARGSRERLRVLTVLIVFAVFSAFSICYYPDVIHLAFVAPVFLVCIAETVEWGLSSISRPARLSLVFGWIMTIVLLFGLAVQMSRQAARLHRTFSIAHETAFGQVDFSRRWETILVDKVRELLDQTASRELFCYPNASSPYLTTGGKNPTRFQFFVASVSPRRQTLKTLSVLEARKIPYILASPLFLSPKDPVLRLINERYDVIDIPEIDAIGEHPGLWLYGRKDLRTRAGSSSPTGEAGR